MGNEWISYNEKLPQTPGWYSVTKSFLIGDEIEESLLWYGDIGNGNHFYIYESPKLGQRIIEFDCLIITWKPKAD